MVSKHADQSLVSRIHVKMHVMGVHTANWSKGKQIQEDHRTWLADQ